MRDSTLEEERCSCVGTKGHTVSPCGVEGRMGVSPRFGGSCEAEE